MNHLTTTETRARRVIRCHACQLQICKSRESLPHGGLKAGDSNVLDTDRFDRTRHAVYACQTCEAVLVQSSDMMEPGWRQLR
jgi:ribosomal protein S27E